MNEKKQWNINMLVMLGLLIAIEVVLSRFLSISTWNIKIGLSFIPVVVAAVMYGPVQAGMVAAVGDFVGAILFPIGMYFPGFTVTAYLCGFVFGKCLYKKRSLRRIIVAIGINQIVFSLFLNSLWISILYGSPYLPLLGTRIFQCIILAIVQFVVIGSMKKVLFPYLEKQVMV